MVKYNLGIDNGHPLNVFGVEQNFNFPTVYIAQGEMNKKQICISEAVK